MDLVECELCCVAQSNELIQCKDGDRIKYAPISTTDKIVF